MPKAHIKTEYECTVCNARYSTFDSAKRCEDRPVAHDKGVQVGDLVRITHGEGRGSLAKVERVFTISSEWGPERYWHTIALTAQVIDSWAHRMLTFDHYEKSHD